MNVVRKHRDTVANPSRQMVRNIGANVIGRAWMMLMSFAFVPIYINLLGVESYAIIGFFATLMVVFSVLDLGLSATLNRELARRSALVDEHASMSDIVRTLELAYWGIGLLIGVAVFALAPFLARDWLNVGSIPVSTVEHAIRLMGIALAFQWPTGLYSGGLMGLQKQVRLNMIDVAISTLRGIGVIGILSFLSPTLDAYFIWQAAITAVGVLLMRWLLWKALPPIARKPRFDVPVFRSVWQFAAGMTGISVLSVIIMQSDKILMSKVLSLSDYAHYLIASGLAAACGFGVGPISNAFYPQLTQRVAEKDDAATKQAYHAGAQMIAVAIIPVSVVVALFPNEILLFWIRKKELADQVAPVVRVLVVGSCFNGLLHPPYLLQLAHGSTRVSLVANIAAAIAIVPLVYLLSQQYGVVGAAFGWPLINFAQLLITAPLVHQRFLPGVATRWSLNDIALPTLVALSTALVMRLIVPSGLPPMVGFAAAAVCGALCLAATASSLPTVRRMIPTRIPFTRKVQA